MANAETTETRRGGSQAASATTQSRASGALARPAFFSGQLLTDRDLTALVDWDRERYRRVRDRHGRGIVRGLELEAAPGAPATVIVRPGYAIGAEGDDIVVRSPAEFDLAAACEQLARDRAEPSQAARPGRARRGAPVLAGATALDIGIAYDEQPQEARAARRQVAAPRAAGTGSSRVLEGFRLTAAPAADPATDPVTTAADAWTKRFADTAEVIRKLPSLAAAGDGGPVKDHLQRHLQQRPLCVFPFQDRQIRAKSPEQLADPRHLVPVLFWIVQDHRLTLLAEPAPEPASGAPVSLGRVWLRPSTDAKGTWQIEAIDAKPPFRERAESQDRPAPPGMVNVADILWQPLDVGAATLAHAGLRAAWYERIDLEAIDRPEALLQVLDRAPFASPAADQVLDYVDVPGLGPRIVGVRPLVEAAPHDLAVDLEFDQARVHPGDPVDVTLVIRNFGKVRLEVTCTCDPLIGRVLDGESLVPRGVMRVRVPLRIPAYPERNYTRFVTDGPDGLSQLELTAMAFGIAEDGKKVEGRSTARLTVLDALGLALAKSAVPAGDPSERRLIYRFDLKNTGRTALRVRLSDPSLPDFNPEAVRIEPGGDRQVSYEDKTAAAKSSGPAGEATAEGVADDGRRVIATATAPAPVAQAIGLELVKAVTRTQVGGHAYTYRVTNTGRLPLNITLTDPAFDGFEHRMRLEPGAKSATFEHKAAPGVQVGPGVDPAIARGMTDDGRQIAATASCTPPAERSEFLTRIRRRLRAWWRGLGRRLWLWRRGMR